MTVSIEIDETIDAPRDVVFDAVVELDQAEEWVPNMMATEKLTEGPMGVGTRWKETREMFGSESTEVMEVTRLERPEVFEVQVDGSEGTTGRGDFRFEYRFEALDDQQTRLGLTGDIGDIGMIMGFVCRIFPSIIEKPFKKDLSALKSYLEA